MSTVDRNTPPFVDFSLPAWALQLWPEAAAGLRKATRDDAQARQGRDGNPRAQPAGNPRKRS